MPSRKRLPDAGKQETAGFVGSISVAIGDENVTMAQAAETDQTVYIRALLSISGAVISTTVAECVKGVPGTFAVQVIFDPSCVQETSALASISGWRAVTTSRIVLVPMTV